MPPPLVVIDTGVVIRALMGRDDSASSRLIDAAGSGLVRVAHSDIGLSELMRIVKEKDDEELLASPTRAFGIAMDLWAHGKLYHPPRRDWPSIPDPNDGWMLDLAFEAGADFIVSPDEKHMLNASPPISVEIITAHEMCKRLSI